MGIYKTKGIHGFINLIYWTDRNMNRKTNTYKVPTKRPFLFQLLPLQSKVVSAEKR